MKIHLVLGDQPPRPGHLNVCPFAMPGDGRVRGSLSHLDEHVADAEARSIVALDVLDYMPAAEYDAILTHWIRKLRHGGTLAIGGLDLREAARQILNGSLDVDQANRFVYGEQRWPWETRKNAVPLPLLCEKLTQMGLKILTKTYQGAFHVVTAQRP